MNVEKLYNTGSEIEAACMMNPGEPITTPAIEVARLLMWAARRIEELEIKNG